MSENFKNKWNLWYHHEKDNWNITGYKKIYEISNIEQFWNLYNNWDKLGSIFYKHFFLMKNDTKPIWEDPDNIKGGCWSYKIDCKNAKELWEELSVYLVSETLSSEEVLGLSITLKKNNNTVIKVWNKDSKKNSITLINNELLEKWGTNVIYIAHMPDKN